MAMAEYLTLFVGAVVINYFVLTKFLGLCIFFGIKEGQQLIILSSLYFL